MKKLAPYFGGALIGIFAIGVFAVVINLSFHALGRIFPDDLATQAIGLVLFDIASLIWFLTFVYRCTSIMQYIWAGFGFLIGLGGTIALVGIEVGLSSGLLESSAMNRPLTYIFIGVAVSHLVLLYLNHSAAPEVSSRIGLGIEKAKITGEGMRQTEEQLEQTRAMLGNAISKRLLADVLRDLNMPVPEIIEGHALPVDDTLFVPTNGYPTQEEKTGFFDKLFRRKQPAPAQSSAIPNDGVVWTEDQEGHRRRLFCMKCLYEGKDWTSPTPCEHVLNATGQPVTVNSSGPTSVPEPSTASTGNAAS